MARKTLSTESKSDEFTFLAELSDPWDAHNRFHFRSYVAVIPTPIVKLRTACFDYANDGASYKDE